MQRAQGARTALHAPVWAAHQVLGDDEGEGGHALHVAPLLVPHVAQPTHGFERRGGGQGVPCGLLGLEHIQAPGRVGDVRGACGSGRVWMWVWVWV